MRRTPLLGDGVAHDHGTAAVALDEGAHVQRVHEVADALDAGHRRRTGSASVTSQRTQSTSSPQANRSGRGSDEDAATTSWPASSRAGTTREPT